MKSCPKCKNTHDKPGKYCSRSCSNSRIWSIEDKDKKSKSAKNFYQSDDGFLRKKEISEHSKQQVHSEQQKKKISETVKGYWTDDKRKEAALRATGRKHSLETKQKLSRISKDNNCGGHTSKRKLFFKKKNGDVVYLQSSYEIRFAQILEDLNIEWSRPIPLKWIDENGADHKYYPDFKIGNIYIDTKNDYLAIKDKPKIDRVKEQNNVDVRIVTNEYINIEYIESLV
jgi:hypothetical protein